MIEIHRSNNADTRTADHLVTKEELLCNSRRHIYDVTQAMSFFAGRLWLAAQRHDHTKLTEINQFYEDFQKAQQHEGDFTSLPWYQLHITSERHHLCNRVPDDVNLIDVMEWIADNVMAGMARSGDVRVESLSPDVLTRAVQNTIELLRNEVHVTQ